MMPPEQSLKFPDLPADHPANQPTVGVQAEFKAETAQSQTMPVSLAVSLADTPADTPADTEHPGDVAEASTGATTEGTPTVASLTTEAVNSLLEQHPDAEVLCVATNLQETAEHLVGVNITRPLALSVEPHDASDVWYLDTRTRVNERRAAQGFPPLGLKAIARAPVPPAPSGVAFDGSVYRARSDNDVLTNTFCKVIAGPYSGRYGVYITTASLGADGWPDQVVVRTRDAEDENIVVAYADIRPDVAGRR
jgi:hypothetical protein